MTFHPQFYKNLFTINPQTLALSIQGGITIAIAASIYFSFYGFILGISGLVGNILKGKFDDDWKKSITIISGLICSSAMVYYMNINGNSEFYPFDSRVTGTNLQLIVSGALVGVGTQLGSGCTSGHGLCGLPRLSLRSITAVMIFLITGILTVTLNLPKLLPSISSIQKISLPSNKSPLQYIIGSVIIVFLILIWSIINTFKKSFKKSFRIFVFFFIGLIFGFGLMLAGMSQRTKIYAFLELNKKWDPSLLFVLMSGVLVNLVTFTIMRKGVKKPIFENMLNDPRGKIDGPLIIGALLFGLGWGIGGLCPGPFILLLPLKDLRIPIFWGISFVVGMKIVQLLGIGKKQTHKQVKQRAQKTA